MGRGRAPCCDKSQVIRGPWSPAEDLRLICYIQKYGHDNWRALPKQAGLLRCGKSCRLRWINYLRPDLKRGNFTAKEEETIIKLHESIGNKWSRIAAHFPGRTDNEIKNVWNTHLKKRLLAKKAAEYKEDVTKETSVITSASSSSSTTVELSHENHKIEIESQIKLLPSSDGSSEKTIFAPNKSIVANQVPQLLQDFESVNKVGSSIHQQSDQLFDSADINQLEEFTMWEDPNLLESLLSAVDSHEWVLAPQDTRVDYTKNNSSCELRTESGIDLWNVLNNDDQPAPAKPVEVPMSQKSMNAAHEYITDNDIDSMFEYLENDQRLARISMEMCQKPGQYQGGDLNHGFPATATGNVVNGSPFMDYFPIWPPQSPN